MAQDCLRPKALKGRAMPSKAGRWNDLGRDAGCWATGAGGFTGAFDGGGVIRTSRAPIHSLVCEPTGARFGPSGQVVAADRAGGGAGSAMTVAWLRSSGSRSGRPGSKPT
jgi:hypothetical protein